MALTDAMVKNAKPKEKIYQLGDHGNMCLDVSPKGGKWWRFRYRFNRKQKQVTLGTYPTVSLKAAREKCNEERILLSKGVDPAAHRKSLKASRASAGANSFEVLDREWLKTMESSWVPNHRIRIVRLFERDVFGLIGAVPVHEVTRDQLRAVLKRVDGHANPRKSGHEGAK